MMQFFRSCLARFLPYMSQALFFFCPQPMLKIPFKQPIPCSFFLGQSRIIEVNGKWEPTLPGNALIRRLNRNITGFVKWFWELTTDAQKTFWTTNSMLIFSLAVKDTPGGWEAAGFKAKSLFCEYVRRRSKLSQLKMALCTSQKKNGA